MLPRILFRVRVADDLHTPRLGAKLFGLRTIQHLHQPTSNSYHWKRGATARSQVVTTTKLPHFLFVFTSSAGSLPFSAAGSAFALQLNSKPLFRPHLRQLSILSRSFSSSPVRLRSRMPPKKKEEEKKVLLGRPGNSLKSGIVCRSIPSGLVSR